MKMLRSIRRYTRWLHTQWPAGTVEKLPEVRSDYSTNIEGLYIIGDLTGIPLLKFSSDSGAKAVKTIFNDPGFKRSKEIVRSWVTRKRKSSRNQLGRALRRKSLRGIQTEISRRKSTGCVNRWLTRKHRFDQVSGHLFFVTLREVRVREFGPGSRNQDLFHVPNRERPGFRTIVHPQRWFLV